MLNPTICWNGLQPVPTLCVKTERVAQSAGKVDGVSKSSETNTLGLDRKFAVRDLAYTAGLLDGEGCITGTSNGTRHSLTVYISSSDMPILGWLQKTFGGGYRCWNSNPKGRRVEKWIIPAASVTPFLKLMIPFLKIKRAQLYKAMSIRSMIEVKKDDTRIVRAIKQLQTLNQTVRVR